MGSTYLIALGSNRRHHRHGRPGGVIRAALADLSKLGHVTASSPVITSDPIGPAQRRFANAAALVACDLTPLDLLAELKQIEHAFGRKGGRVWGDRVLDLDIVMWSGGAFATRALTVPHREFAKRTFVLGPASTIAPLWRDPLTGLTIRQLIGRLSR